MANARMPAAAAAAGSAALLIGAFGFQHLGGLAPCELCLWQRWPHAVAILLGVAGVALGGAALRVLAAAAALALLIGAGIGVYHVGVEQAWWAGPGACSGGPALGALSTDELLAQIRAAPVVRCDDVAWSLGGVSMAGWNAGLSVALAALFAYASSSASQYR